MATSKKSRFAAPAATANATAAPIAERPVHVLLAANIADRADEMRLHSFNAENLAGLLDGLSESGYSEASAQKDQWQLDWWSQVGYLADVLKREAAELRGNLEAVKELARQIRGPL